MKDATDRRTPDLIHGGLRIGYARVCTDDQNLDLQHDALKAAGCADIYSDKISGTKAQRPELDNALRALRRGDTLVVWRLDRLGGSLKHLVDLVIDLEKRGVALESLTESIDTKTATGRMVAQLFEVLAEFERNLISERTKAGIKAARARGRNGGRKQALSEKDLKELEILLSDPSVQVTDMAKRYGVSRTTLYRHVNWKAVKDRQLRRLMEEEAHG